MMNATQTPAAVRGAARAAELAAKRAAWVAKDGHHLRFCRGCDERTELRNFRAPSDTHCDMCNTEMEREAAESEAARIQWHINAGNL